MCFRIVHKLGQNWEAVLYKSFLVTLICLKGISGKMSIYFIYMYDNAKQYCWMLTVKSNIIPNITSLILFGLKPRIYPFLTTGMILDLEFCRDNKNFRQVCPKIQTNTTQK